MDSRLFDTPWTDANAPRFVEALRGIDAQGIFEFPREVVPTRFKTSAVLLLFFPVDGQVHVVLTRRSPRLANHAGEICFPGGRLEPGESPVDAALREAREEIGLASAGVCIHGRLDDAWAFAGHLVVPIVASLDRAPCFSIAANEVEAVLVERLDVLFEPSRWTTDVVPYRGVEFTNARVPMASGDSLFGLSADLLLEVRDRVIEGTSTRGRARCDELCATREVGLLG